MTSSTSWIRLAPACAFLLATLSPSLQAQNNYVLTVAPVGKLVIKRGTSGEIRLKAELRPGFHVNSNAPADEFLIPLKLTWAKTLETEQVIYPKPQFETYAFSSKPVSVFTGSFEIVSRVKAPADAPNGPGVLTGKLRYQACNEKECLPPRTADVTVSLDIR